MTAARLVVVSVPERAVIGELARDGANNPAIAARLGITPHVVRNRLKAVMKRTGHNTRTALVIDLLTGRIKLRTVDSVRAAQHERISG